MLFAQPSPVLAPYVKFYWGIENNSCPGKEYEIKIIPSGLVELDFYLGPRPEIIQSERSISENSMISGQQKNHYNLRISENLFMFSVIFEPAGAMLFFDMPMQEIFNQNVPLRELFKAEIEQIETKLFDAPSFNDRVTLMNQILFKQLSNNFKRFEYQRIDHCVQLINNARGEVSVEFLASETCLSRKQFERIFQHCIGCSPKQFLRVVRFQYAVYNRQKDRQIALTQLAFISGYYDQSHMISEFKSLSGLTPKQFFSDCNPHSDYFA